MGDSVRAEPLRRHRGMKVAMATAGLALGFVVAMGLARVDGSAGRGRAAPSVEQFSFSTVVPRATQAEAAAAAFDREPADPAEAVTLLLQAARDGEPARSYGLLDAESRKRHPSAAAWARSQAGYPPPRHFRVISSSPGSDGPGTVEVIALVAHEPSLDPFRGLVPAESERVWRVTQEDGRWRVNPDVEILQIELPPADAASDVVRGWLAALSACDAAAARGLQAIEPLYGPADLAAAACRQRGTWSVGAALTFDEAPDGTTLQAAFGADVASWARLVPVRGPTTFLAALAPMGDTWRVMGAIPDVQRSTAPETTSPEEPNR